MELLGRIYNSVIRKDEHGVSFQILLWFLLTFIGARLSVYAIDNKIFPDFFVYVGETHIHHLNYGIFLLAASGYLSLVLPKSKFPKLLPFLYGVGLGLTFDEFALWLTLQDNYYARASYEAIVVVAVILINATYFHTTWVKIFGVVRHPIKKFKQAMND